MKKRWLILTIVLIVIAIVLAIVFVNLFRPKNTQALAKNVTSVTNSGYLSEENSSNKQIDQYLELLSSQNIEKEEVEAFFKAYQAFEVAGKFFDRQMIFSTYSKTYQNNLKNVQKNFQHAQDAAQKLENYLLDNLEKIDDSFVGRPQWLVLSWQDCKADMKALLVYSGNAFEALTNIFVDSVASKIVNNTFCQVVLQHFTQTAKFSNEETLDGAALLSFANAYLSVEGEKQILQHEFSQDLQNKAKDLQEKQQESEFFKAFVEGTLIV